MRTGILGLAMGLVLGCPLVVTASEVDRILATYAKLETVSCRIRRTVDGPGGKVRFLSRVHFRNDDHIHVENFSPVKRRMICDGTRFFSYAEGDPKGFSRPVSELSEEMLLALRKVPGTAGEHLLRLRGSREASLPATSEFPRRLGYETPKIYAVLGLDAQNRPAGLDFFRSSKQEARVARYRYSEFTEVAPGVEIPFRHEGVLFVNGREQSRESLRVDALVVNQPMAPSLFQAEQFFDSEITFVDSFESIYK